MDKSDTPSAPHASESPHTVVVVVDGLRASALGAYGNAAYETPALDAFAVDSTVWDWCYADTPDLASIYSALEESMTSRVKSQASLLVTDEPELLSQPIAEIFTETVQIEYEAPQASTQFVGDTTTAQIWAGFAEALAAWRESFSEKRLFAWLHTRGMYGAWDAPSDLYESLVDEDDPPVEASVLTPNEIFEDASSGEACEARFAAGVRYAAQVMALDRCFASWLDIIDGLFEGEDLQIIVVGLRGFPLGEHGRVGGIDDRLYSEQQHVSLMARAVQPNDRFMRQSGSIKLSAAMSGLLGSTRDASATLLASPSGARSVHTGEWLLRQPGPTEAAEESELYVKPDDRWEQNDVASLRSEVVNDLLELLAADG